MPILIVAWREITSGVRRVNVLTSTSLASVCFAKPSPTTAVLDNLRAWRDDVTAGSEEEGAPAAFDDEDADAEEEEEVDVSSSSASPNVTAFFFPFLSIVNVLDV